MPILGVAMAGRWASFNPILIDRFPYDFGFMYGAVISLSETITFLISLMAGLIQNETGSYMDTLIVLAGF